MQFINMQTNKYLIKKLTPSFKVPQVEEYATISVERDETAA